MELKKGRIINKRYEIIEKIGVGGMSNVYCAKDLKLERLVTFKVLKEEFIDEDFIKGFKVEAQAAAKLSHNNIANVYDVGNEEKIHYIVMEYIDGYTLKELIKEKAPLSNEEIIGIGIQIATALEAAHNSNIAHKDIKPQNILVTKEGIVKVTDFGIAKAITSTTITNNTMGSVHYFSPEQARGGYVDNRTDIYSLGIILYEMSTGQLPFDGENTVQLAMKHINESLPPIEDINSNISESIKEIIIKCTEKNTNERYADATSLINDLKTALKDETGNFVKKNSENIKEQETIMISKNETNKIKNMSKNINNNVEEDNYKKMRKKVTIYAVITAFIVMAITFRLTLGYLNSTFKEVYTPNFVGKTLQEAEKIASENEIYLKNVEERYSETFKEGTIIEQSIQPKTKIKRGESIEIILSLGSGKFVMPDFTGMDISDVYDDLSSYQVDINQEYVYDDEVEKGKVIKHIPSKGRTVSYDDSIEIYISKGKEDENTNKTIIVPNVVGMSEKIAKDYLTSRGIIIGKVDYIESETIGKGKVVGQSIKADTEINQEQSIDITVSLGVVNHVAQENQNEKLDNSTNNAASTSTPNSENESNSSLQTNESSNISQENVEEPKAIKKDTLVISPIISENKSDVEVRVVQINSQGNNEIYINQHSISDFPLNINVLGNEKTEYQIYVDGIYQNSEIKLFE